MKIVGIGKKTCHRFFHFIVTFLQGVEEWNWSRTQHHYEVATWPHFQGLVYVPLKQMIYVELDMVHGSTPRCAVDIV